MIELLCSEVPDVVLSIKRALGDKDLATTYARLPSVDFSRDILAHKANRLLVLCDSRSGWADLGSRKRVLGLLAKQLNQPPGFVKQAALAQKPARRERRTRGIGGNRHIRMRRQFHRELLPRRSLESAREHRSVDIQQYSRATAAQTNGWCLNGTGMKISSPAQEAAASASHGGAGS